MSERMKAITLWQPWAQLIALGAKRIETRSWRTSYRGWLAIHAAKKSTGELRDLAAEWPFAEYLTPYVREHGPLPLGAIVAVARVEDCIRTERLIDALAPGEWHADAPADWPEHERDFGNYQPERYGWVLSDVVALPEPVTCSGEQGLWTPPAHVVDQLRTQYRAAINPERTPA